MSAGDGVEFVVRRDELARAELRPVAVSPLASGQARLAIERFAFTSNNLSYATSGDALGYWAFFPAEDGWGRIPAWGFATVEDTASPAVAVGERVWGFYPMSTHVVLEPARASRHGFVDGAPHRQALAAVYNQYTRCAVDPWHSAGGEDVEALLRPLYATSWLLDDFVAGEGFFGARTLLLSSASSKTAYGTAWQLAKRGGIEVVGLTSGRNRAFCESLGCYGRVLAYDELEGLAADTPCVHLDFAGDARLRAAIHRRFADLRYDCAIGATHIADLGGSKGLPGPRPVFFFAPAQVDKRTREWGFPALMQRMVGDWSAFRSRVVAAPDPWLVAVHHFGPDAVRGVYESMLAGGGDPRQGHVLSLRAA